MDKAIFGAGGFSREVRLYGGLLDIPCFVDRKYWNGEEGVLPSVLFDPFEHELLVAIGDPFDRSKVVNNLPAKTVYWTFSRAKFLDAINVGAGSVLCEGSIITTGVTIGKHNILNLHTSVGHDSTLGDFVTLSPGARISGNCTIGNRVYFGTNACCKEGITICDDVIIGMGSAVTKDITEPGTYAGLPARKIK